MLRFFFLATLVTLASCSQPATNNADNACTPACEGLECGDDGCGGTCGSCVAPEACTAGICAPATCGNGQVDPGETCDESAGSVCATEAGCEPLGGCFSSSYSGNPLSCDALCETTRIETCMDGDDCCPPGCTPSGDRDCVPETCGNGTVDPGETCDEPAVACVTAAECQPTHSCDRATLTGEAFTCVVTCNHVDIVACQMVDDGCCPPGCDFRTDADCPAPVCGNAVVEALELCDTGIDAGDPGACPADCNDNRACTTDLTQGDQCTISCSHATQTSCTDGDGCCPPTCTNANDDDCANVACGDGVVDGDEGCDNALPAGAPGACPQSDADCDDADPCTTDSMTGNGADCSARCLNAPLPCGNGDGCCPFTCTANNDAECDALDLCGTMCFRAVNYCMNGNEIFADSATCDTACRDMPTGRAADTTSDSVYCRINHLADALDDAVTHCPHAAVDAPEGCTD